MNKVNPRPAAPRFYTKAEMLAVVKVSYGTVLRYQARLGFPKGKALGSGPTSPKFYLADAVDAWLIKRLT